MDATTKAIIKRASKKGRARLRVIDKEVKQQLRQLYAQARADVERSILLAESLDGTVKIERLAQLRQGLNARLLQLDQSRDELLTRRLRDAVETGISPFTSVGVGLADIADEALLQTVHFVADDGLQLSDRIWRVNQHEREIIANQVEQAIIRGDSAARATREFLTNNLDIPNDIQSKLGQAQATKIASATGKELMAKGSPYQNALRLFRTEINRAHGEAYQAAAFDSEDVIGTQFLLSPNHPETDICDMHARVNRYGLGNGVYPQGKNPWPAHPNTMSFTVVVFDDEVTAEDKAGQEDRISFLKKQSPARQQQILGGRKKRAALHLGHLRESQINTPWKVLRQRYQRQGIDVDNLVLPTQVRASHIRNPEINGPQPNGVKVSSVIDPIGHASLMDYTTTQIDGIHGDGKLPFIPVKDIQSNRYLGYYSPNPSTRHIGIAGSGSHPEMTAAHELGHFLDDKGLPGRGWSSDKHKALADWRQATFNSESYQTLERLHSVTTDVEFKAHLEYLLQPIEAWARSYAQYIAVKSGSDKMLKQLADLRFTNPGQIDIPRQWPDEDFGAISDSIDALFVKIGWIE